jgi:aldehyde dehydrogenase (NAD+)
LANLSTISKLSATRSAPREISNFEQRREWLLKFESVLKSNEKEIYAALKKDLGKCELEAYAGELAPLYEELRFALNSLEKWMNPKNVPTPFWKVGHLMGRSEIRAEPRGRVLILAPWNYPLYLTLTPVIGALAAGNRVVLKPSELSPHCSTLFEKLIRENFDADIFSCVTGSVDEAKRLLNDRWDLIFFTGGPRAAKEIYEAAAKNLTPVILELGGKSPAIFDLEVPFEISIRRLMWGKFFNAGQTCVAPDYVLVPESRLTEFIEVAKITLRKFYGEDAYLSSDYARIINERHFDRLVEYLGAGKIICGGRVDRPSKYIEPTLIIEPRLDSALMRDEIFGPILPIITYRDDEEAIEFIERFENPLALYIFSQSSAFQTKILDRVPSGGVCINDCLVHLTNPHLPFGGVGESGIGAYHGDESFRAFSHFRAIERKPLWADIGLRYPPYKIKLNRFLKWFI